MTEEDLYKLANEELNSRNRKPDLWARACALATDDVDEARYLYTNLRVEELALESNIDLTASHLNSGEPAELTLLDTIDLSSSHAVRHVGAGLTDNLDPDSDIGSSLENGVSSSRPVAGVGDDESLSDEDIIQSFAGNQPVSTGATDSDDIDAADTLTISDAAEFGASDQTGPSDTSQDNSSIEDMLATPTQKVAAPSQDGLTPAQQALARLRETGGNGHTVPPEDNAESSSQVTEDTAQQQTADQTAGQAGDLADGSDHQDDSPVHASATVDESLADQSGTTDLTGSDLTGTSDQLVDQTGQQQAAMDPVPAGDSSASIETQSSTADTEQYQEETDSAELAAAMTATTDDGLLTGAEGDGSLFNVFETSSGETRAVKQGVSWAALFFTLPWLLKRGMFGLAATYSALWIVLLAALLVLGLRYLDHGTFMSTHELIVAGLFGVLAVIGLLLLPFLAANDWYSDKLISKGYRLQTGIWASGRNEAIAAFQGRAQV